MIPFDLLLTFIVAVLVLMAIPGPNVALIVANSVAHGTRYGLLTVAGTSTAVVIQLCLTALGMVEVLRQLGVWFEWIRWAGVIYLVYLGIRIWRAPPADLANTGPEPRSARNIFVRAFLVASTNPKTLLFYGAFFPQFVTPGAESIRSQIAWLCLTFLVLAVLCDSAWAIAAGRARALLTRRAGLRNRITGALLVTAGVGLALARSK